MLWSKTNGIERTRRETSKNESISKDKEEIEIEKMAKNINDNLNELDILPYNRDLWRKGGIGWSKGDLDRGKGWTNYKCR